MGICYLDGEFLPLAQARVSVLDRGFIFGDAVYEVIPAAGGRLFAGEEHLARLARSLEAVGIADPMPAPEWRRCLAELLERNGGGDLSVYVQVTRGVAERDHLFPAAAAPTVFAMCRPLRVDGALARVAAVVLEDNRWGRCDIKSTSLLPNVLLRNEAARRGAYEAILARDGWLTEGAASNVFVIAADRVRTPPLSARLLGGVTRGLLIEVMRGAGIAVDEVEIRAAELPAADEIWLSSSSRDLLCVETLDGRAVGRGDYPLARGVFDAFRRHRERRLSGA